MEEDGICKVHTRVARALRRVAMVVLLYGSRLRAVKTSSCFKSIATILTFF